MSKIKVSELPQISYKDLKDSDIVLVETGKDTYKMTVADAKVLFSCDTKINALSEAVSNQIDELSEYTKDTNTGIITRLEQLEQAVNNTTSNSSKLAERITKLEETSSLHDNRISTNEENILALSLRADAHDETFNNTDERINNINLNIDSIESNIDSLAEIARTNVENITSIGNTLNDLQDQIDNLKTSTGGNLEEKVQELTELVNSRYDELQNQIDFWHHTDDQYVKL